MVVVLGFGYARPVPTDPGSSAPARRPVDRRRRRGGEPGAVGGQPDPVRPGRRPSHPEQPADGVPPTPTATRRPVRRFGSHLLLDADHRHRRREVPSKGVEIRKGGE